MVVVQTLVIFSNNGGGRNVHMEIRVVYTKKSTRSEKKDKRIWICRYIIVRIYVMTNIYINLCISYNFVTDLCGRGNS